MTLRLFQLFQALGNVVGHVELLLLGRLHFKIFLLNQITFRKDDSPLDEVFQFPNVTRKRIPFQQSHGIGCNPANLLAEFLGEFLEEETDQERQVPFPVTQRGQVDGDYVQAEEQVFPKSSLRDHGAQVAVGRSDKPDVDGDRLRASDGGNFPLLKDAQQLCLSGEADVRYLVEEQCPTICNLEEAGFRLDCAGERAFHMAEQLTFQKVFGKGGTIDGNERVVTAGTVPVDCTGDKFFTRAALSRDEHGAVRRRNLKDATVDPLHLAALTDEHIETVVVPQLLPQVHAVQEDSLLLVCPVDFLDDLIRGKGFGEVIDRTAFHGFDGSVDRGVARYDDDRYLGLKYFNAFEHFKAAHTRHLKIGDDKAEVFILHSFDSGPAGTKGFDFVPFIFENSSESFPDYRLVVNN